MKKLTIAIAISSLLALAACDKPNDAGTSQSDPAFSEQQANPSGSAAETLELSEQAAFEAPGADSGSGNSGDKRDVEVTEDMTRE